MASARVEVIQTVRPSDEPADHVVNVCHFNSGTDFQQLAQFVLECFDGTQVGPGGQFSAYQGRKIEVRSYDIADAKPRPIKGHATFTPTTWDSSALGPRLLAVCLSFYATRNLPRIRGRMYLGPWAGSLTADDVIPDTTMQIVLNLGEVLHQGVGGWQHITRSNKEASEVGGGGEALAEQRVTNYWCDSNWDVMHSRSPRTATRKLWP